MKFTCHISFFIHHFEAKRFMAFEKQLKFIKQADEGGMGL